MPTSTNGKEAAPMDIATLIATIPEDSTDEALMAVETIITYSAQGVARVRVHLTHPFCLWLRLRGGAVTLTAPGRPGVQVPAEQVVEALRREIHCIDEAIEQGRYTPPPLKEALIPGLAPPPDMDLPVWDPDLRQWYDAEY